MSEQNTPLTPEQTLQNIEQVRDLFARSHDFLAQATFPGHMGTKVAECLDFLAFQYGDFKIRCENLSKQIKSTVDVKAAEAAVAETLTDTENTPVAEAPKA